MLQLPDFVTILSLVLSVVIWFIVLRNPGRKTFKALYTGVTISVVFWLLSLYFYYSVEDVQLLHFIGRFNFAIIGLGFISLYFFTKLFPFNWGLKLQGRDWLVLATSLVFLGTQFTDLFVMDELVTPGGGRETIFGDLYPLYLGSLLLLLALFIWNLYRNYRDASAYYRVQVRYFAIGLTASMIFGFTTNVIFPLLGVFVLQQFGPIAVIFLVGSIGFLIVKHRFLSINLAIGQSVVVLMLSTATYGIFYFITITETTLFNSVNSPQALVFGIPAAIIFVLCFLWLNRQLDEKISQRIINPNFSPGETLARLNAELSTVVDHDLILEKTIKIIDNSVAPGFLQFLFVSALSEPLTINSGQNLPTAESVETIKALDPEGKEKYLILEDLVDSSNLSQPARSTVMELKKTGARLVLPITNQKKHLGYLILGAKEEDRPYMGNELEFLQSVRDILFGALERALLYSEIKDLNENLQAKVDQATAAVQKNYAELQEVYRKEKDMTDILAHELRTPLSISRNAFEMLATEIAKPDSSKDRIDNYVDMVRSNLLRELKLLETMLSSTKIDNEKVQLETESLDLNLIAKSTAENHQTDASEKKLALGVESRPEPTIIAADKNRLLEVVDNLVSNALKYTREGTVTIKVVADATRCGIAVVDTGEGIPAEDIPNLGKKFYRVNQHIDSNDSPTQAFTRPGGTGLGLYVSFGLVKLMGGTIEVNSEVGKGSSFAVWFPTVAAS